MPPGLDEAPRLPETGRTAGAFGAPEANDATPLRVLLVCEANQCRSPAAEYLLRWELEARGLTEGIEVASAGLRAAEGIPMDPTMAELVAARGPDPVTFRSRWLTDQEIERSGLVLTATREQRSSVLERVPLALRRTFTLLEFAHAVTDPLPAGVDQQRSGWPDRLVATVGAARSRHRPAEYDITDPIGRSRETCEWVTATIHLAVWKIAERLARPV